MFNKPILSVCLFLLSLVVFISCGPQDQTNEEQPEAEALQDSTDRVAVIEGGLAGPEAIRYDSEQNVYFISNFNGESSAADSNGYIARAQADGTIDSLKFITGTAEAPLHSPRGMYIAGDTLFVADLKGVHQFNKRTGDQIGFTDFTDFEPGFLNDIAVGPNGAKYITDTGQARVYKMEGSEVTIAFDSLQHPPNGITLDSSNNRLILAPWNGGQSFLSFTPPDSALSELTTAPGGNFDGIEPINGSFVVASQADSSLYLIGANRDSRAVVKTAPEPADIAFNTKLNQVAVPYINLNRVDIWQIDSE